MRCGTAEPGAERRQIPRPHPLQQLVHRDDPVGFQDPYREHTSLACRVAVGSDDPDRLALWMAQLDVDIEVIDGDELAVAFDRLATRFRRAAGGAST